MSADRFVKEFDCPGCRATLRQCGIVTHDGHACPVFQCETCRKQVTMFDEKFDVALTFLVTRDGRVVDPGDQGSA